MIRFFRFICLLLCWHLFIENRAVKAQEKPSGGSATNAESTPRPRPKIGVALEGGGALGLAHIGVLQWFEDHHIPVDYIAGTSMGGLVGGLYATGKSPRELEQVVAAQSWDIIIGGQTPFEDLSYRRKEDSRDYPTFIQFGLKKGLSLPAGLNAGHKINLLIDRETLPYSELKSFDDLPIPYRCVATDLVSGQEVVFSDGNLPLAMRASMSIPGVFKPVRNGDQVLVDGGLVGNLPTDVVRKMGADIVIAVHLELAPVKADEIQSFFSVLGRSIDVIVRENELHGLAAADLVVKVDLHEFTSLNYEKSKAIIEKGLAATEEKHSVLQPFALNDSDWQAYISARNARRRATILTPQFVRVTGTSTDAAKHLEDFLQPLVGKPLDTAALERLLTRLTGIGKFDSVGYAQIQESGRTGLLVAVSEKAYAPPTLQFASEVDGSEPLDVTFTLAGRLTLMDVAGYRSEWRTDILFGNTYGVSSEVYKPLTATSKWFVAPHASLSSTQFKIFQRSDPIVIYRLGTAHIGADLGYGFDRFSEIRFGYEVGDLDARVRLGLAVFPSVSGRTGNAKLHFLIDHGDDPIVPRRGYTVETTFRWFDNSPGAPEGFPAMQAQLQYFKPITRPASLFFAAEGGTTFGTRDTGPVPQFFLGGPLRLSAYGTNELFGNQYYLFRIGYLHDLFTLPPFLGKKIYAIGSYEFAKMYGFPLQTGFPNDVTAGVLAETALGPLVIGGSYGDSGHRKLYFQLGRVF
ncbi:MAG TPA: patatin-like phospholipase family protein [Candidatus Eisenbacteria bacterium]|nr:patatin-like phospholipase family protein [Candidatus Eisenbacteria bacterium]